ncbi:MAG: phosphate ABC transporter ATP-binding protein PstB [Anaerolineales bacterium]
MPVEASAAKFRVRGLSFFYGAKPALRGVSVDLAEREITALIGPSGCGKTTFLRCLNRMHDGVPHTLRQGEIWLDDVEINSPAMDVTDLRRRVGMVFQKPNPFPQSVFDNVAFGPRVLGLTDGRADLEARVERSLREAVLWEEVKDRLSDSALGLSLGEQQRLCIARVLAVEPEVVLMDEPCSALDPVATLRIEELMARLRERYTLIIVTHNMQQAARVSDKTGVFWLGELVEFGETGTLFTRPGSPITENYLTGRVG